MVLAVVMFEDGEIWRDIKSGLSIQGTGFIRVGD